MSLMPIGFEELEALLAIVEHGSFRAASEELHKAQSSVSYSIKNLEKELDITIFDRSTYKPKLTKEGQVIFNKARNLLTMFDDLKELSSFLSSGVEASLSIVFSIIFPMNLLEMILTNFQAEYPQTRLNISFSSFAGPMNKLVEGEADIIIASDADSGSTVIEKEFWRSIEFLPVASPEHAAADPNLHNLSFDDLTEIIVGERSLSSIQGSEGLVQSSNTWHLTDFETKRKLLLASLGWGYMPSHYIEDDLNSDQLLRVSQKNALNFNLYLMREKTDSYGPAAQYLWNLLKGYSLVAQCQD